MTLENYSREEWPEELEIDGEPFESESFGAYKQVYKSQDGEKVGLISKNGETLEEQALHMAGIFHNEEQQREYGLSTATEYTPRMTEIEGEPYVALTGDFRNDLVTHGELDDLLNDPDMQERVYHEVFEPIRELAESGKTTASPLDFININNRDNSSLIFDTRNFGYSPETDDFHIIDNGELEPHGFGTENPVPDAYLSDYSFAEPEDFTYDRPHDSLEEFIEDNKVDRKAQEMLEELK